MSRRRGLRCLLILLCVTSALATAGAQVQYVPIKIPTIQAALNAAQPHSTILVGAGVYRENLIWPEVDGIRVIAEAGAALTTLDAGYRGRAIKFGKGLTRATLLQGFTIVGGADREGAGVYIDSSPTLRDNRIFGCVGEDLAQNRGGGIFIEAWNSPRIEGNIILQNVLKNGKTNLGAGIFVADGACPEILANTVQGNRCEGPDRCQGGGIYVGLTGTPSPIVTGNIVVQNKASGLRESLGGGVFVAGGTTFLVNNTIADNTCESADTAMGGGVALGSFGAAGSRFQNNILVRNKVSAVRMFGGGIFCSGAAPVIDFNDVWGNLGGDYFGCIPGLNDRFLDPGFAGAFDYHLSGASPCIDAGSSALVLPGATRDPDGDPRFLDGNLDGWAGNGARVDLGGDEHSQVRLGFQGMPFLGENVQFNVTGMSGSIYMLLLSPTMSDTFVSPFGNVLIGFPAVLLSSGITPTNVPLVLPSLNALAGIQVHVQGLVARSSGGRPVGQLTNRMDITLTRLFTNPIIEDFKNTKHKESGVTTAGWTLGGQPGLYATYGFGGNGEDGDLLVSGPVTLDSSTRPPGASGLSEWNFNVLQVARGSTLTLTGNHPIRINVFRHCAIEGVIDASGRSGLNGPAGTAVNVGPISGGIGGPGAGAGGDANRFPSNPIGALPMELRGGPGYPKANICGNINKSDNRLITVVEPNCGGGTGGNRGLPSGTILRNGCSGNGGGHMTFGVQTDYLCSNIGAYGREPCMNWIVATGLNAVARATAGTGGGAGGNAAMTTGNPSPQNDIVAGSGGGAGGGVEVEVVGTLVVRPSASILADGGSGGMGHSTLAGSPPATVSGGYGAGGAGGSIWLSGTSVTVDAQAVLSAVGGKGNPSPPTPSRTGDGGNGYVIIRDLSGAPSVNSTNINPTPVAGRGLFAPSNPGKSYAYSAWYTAATHQNLHWSFDASNPLTGEVISGNDLTFQVPPVSGQKVYIAWQGSPDVNGKPHPDPARWVPAGNSSSNPFAAYETDIGKLRARGDLRHIRFRVLIDLGAVSMPLPRQVVISRIMFSY